MSGDEPSAGPVLGSSLVAGTRTFWVPRWIIERSWTILRQDGLKGVESTILWGGRRFGDEAAVMTLVYPCGHDVEFHRRYVRVGSDTTAEMGRWLRAQGMSGLIQVHTHPGTWTGHSDTDNDFPIASSDGFVSLVWPEFARLPVAAPSDFGIYRIEHGQWREITGEAAKWLIRIVESEGLIWASADGVFGKDE